MTTSKKRRKGSQPEHRPYRVQAYLTEDEGAQLASYAERQRLTQSQTARELITAALQLVEIEGLDQKETHDQANAV